MSNVSQSTLYTLRIISLCIAVITLGQFFLYGSFNNLRLNKEILSFAENQYYQIVFIPIALLLLSKVLTNKSRVDIIFLVFSISPFLLSGSRKELFILFCSLFFVYRKSIGGKSLICMSLFIAFMLILPLFREGAGVYDVFVSFHEFILPQYGFFLYYESATSLHFGGSDLISGVWSLLPGVLRLSEFITIGNALSQYGLANNIGLASNPALEAHINFGDVGYLIFPFIIFSYFLLCRLIVTKKIIFLSPFLFYLIVLGRSDVWLTVFFALYTSVFMFLAIKRFKNR
ncbi:MULTISPECIES: hypothetical protein [Aeromonas]|nr:MULTISPECIES: hypothetical protein [Aeromonas]MBL0659355.1 hypothetical protein [Aeromonas dhakensis]MCO4113563.1 hypothetical protein [Aeromonas hydrophila]QEE13607.1 hypothetical protein C1A23_25510 [Aeromonas hydrophila subsp. hydrophila]